MKLILPLDSDPFPVVDKKHWKETNSNEQLQKDERLRCKIEPLYWLLNYVYTLRKDENVDGGVVERFPNDEYLVHLFHQFFTEPKLAIDKARQMRMTWIMMAGYLWYVQYRENEEIICQTKKEQDADKELVQRAKFIHEHQPGWLSPKCHYTYNKLKCKATNSILYGIPSGGDQIRSHNPTRVFIDEGGFFEGEFEESRTAAIACCKDIKCVSTANAGEWKDFITDAL